MSFVLEGPNVSNSSANGVSSNNLYHSSGGGGIISPATATAAAAADSGFDESISYSPHSEQNPLSTPCASPSSAPVIPPLLMSLKYRARVRGLMQPRRMDAALPNPSFMACGALPKMQRAHSIASASGGGSSGGGGGDCASGDGAAAASVVPFRASPFRKCLRRPSLGHISSVAALERPPATYRETSRIGDDSGADHLNSTPSSSENNSLAASPENTLPLGTASPSNNAVAATGTATATAAAGGQINIAAAPSQAESAPLWRRAFGFNRPQPGAAAKTGGANNNFDLLRSRRGATFDESALPVCLVNKSPHWNEALRCWCLDFRGRVKLASVKNFQLVKEGDEDSKVNMQFGKFSKDLFILDFNPMTMSAIQAFAVALTTFDSKVTL